jgi:hypothetical protein
METFNAIQLSHPGVVYASLLFILGAIFCFPSDHGHFICINQHSWDIFHRKAKEKFEYNAFALLRQGLEKVS